MCARGSDRARLGGPSTSPLERMGKLLVLFALVASAGLVACGSEHSPDKRIEASATATTSPSGEIVVRKPTSDEMAGVKRISDLNEQVNRLFPAPKPPVGVSGSNLVRLSDDGVFTLANGDRVSMDGVSCSPEGLDVLRRLLIEDGTVVVVSRRSSGSPAPAELWSARNMGLSEPSYSAIAETAITNGWCAPKSSPTNPLNQRYQALAQAFSGQVGR